MDRRWRWNRFGIPPATLLAFLFLFTFQQNLSLSLSLNVEGLALLRFRERVIRDPFGALSNWNENGGELHPCSWFGVECSNGKVIILNLQDLCLEGTLAPELGKLAHVKSIIFRNNSFSGQIPKEIGQLKELEVFDLGYNNFTGPFPSDIGNSLSLSILLLDNNKFLGGISQKVLDLTKLSEFQVDKNILSDVSLGACCSSQLTSRRPLHDGDIVKRKLLQAADAPSPTRAKRIRHKKSTASAPASMSLSQYSPPVFSRSISTSKPPLSSISFPPLSSASLPSESPTSSPSDHLVPSPSPTLPPSPASQPSTNPPEKSPTPPKSHLTPLSSPASTPHLNTETNSKSKRRAIVICSGVLGGSLFICLSTLGIFCCQKNKGVSVKPWATGLSGQLQKAFVSGVPKLQRPELETACEDFSNIIGTLPAGTVYKGTLSSGVEIAVVSAAVKSADEWSKNLEAQFRNKVDTLSKVNHKNFVNLIGYCKEDQPFTRMMVFEYAPNGTLFEHLHMKEAEHLDWGMRLRIAMGMAYCLEYMHQLNPPVAHRNLQSSSVYLTEDYAAKIADLELWNEVTAGKKRSSADVELLEAPSADPESNVYSFGIVLFEMITGRIPNWVDIGSLVYWTSDWVRGEQEQPLRELVDPTLKSFQEADIEKLFQVVKDCVNPDLKKRLKMGDVTAKLKEITAMGPDGATPKLSPLWWAELEILSTESS